MNNFQDKANFIWQVADDILRGTFKQHEYGDVILPFVVLWWLNCVLNGKKSTSLRPTRYSRMNDTYKIELTQDDRLDIGRMHEKLQQRDDLRSVMTSANTLENMRYKFDKVVDELLLDFVHAKLDLFKKLSDPKVNPMFQSKWFEWYLRGSKSDFHQKDAVQ